MIRGERKAPNDAEKAEKWCRKMRKNVKNVRTEIGRVATRRDATRHNARPYEGWRQGDASTKASRKIFVFNGQALYFLVIYDDDDDDGGGSMYEHQRGVGTYVTLRSSL